VRHWHVYLAAFFGGDLDRIGKLADPRLAAVVAKGRSRDAVSIKQLDLLRKRQWDVLSQLFRRYDALLSPTMTRPAVEVDEDDARYHPVTSGGRKRGLDITSVFNWVPWCPALSVPAGFRSVCTSPLRLIGKTQLFASPPPSNASIRINGHRSGNRECNREREVDMATNELSVRRPFPQTFVGSRGHSLLPGGFGKALTAFGPWSPMAGLAPVGRHEARAGGLPGQFHVNGHGNARPGAASQNGAPVVGGSSPGRMDRSSSATMTPPSIRPHLPRKSGRKML
jgi:hypothetical protein